MGLNPSDDQTHRCSVRLTPKGSIGGLDNVGGALYLVGYGRPVGLGYVLYEITQAPVLADGDGEAHVVAAAYGDDVVSVEAAVGPHGERSGGSGVAHPAQRLTRGSVLRPGR